MRNLLLLFLLLLTIGCNSEKRATRHLYKAVRINPDVPLRYCADNYKGVDSVHEKIVYKAGVVKYDTVVNTEIEVINDTVYKTQVKYVTKYQVDTQLSVKYVQVENKANIILLTNQFTDLQAKYAKKGKALDIAMWALAVLSAYTLLRWTFRWLTNIKLP